MRLAVISDLHLGADSSVLNLVDGQGNQVMDHLVEALLSNGGKLDHLVLLGDVFDLSLVSFRDAWVAAQKFLRHLDQAGVTDKIVYAPGNHDFTMWHYFEQDLHVTRKTQASPPALPENFEYTMPGYIDPANGLWIAKAHDGSHAGQPYSGGFFQGLWQGGNKEFAVVYPNLYVSGDDLTLLTHGQYFDLFWNLVGDVSLDAAADQLKTKKANKYTISELVQMNYATSVLDASAIGQAGIFSRFAQTITEEVANGDVRKVISLKNALLRRVDRMGKPKRTILGLGKEKYFDALLYGVSAYLNKKIKDMVKAHGPRYNSNYVEENKDVIEAFLGMATEEYAADKGQQAEIRRMFFGHTHDPSVPNQPETLVRTPSGNGIPCYNTGGWIKNHQGHFNGAVALFDSERPTNWAIRNIDEFGIGARFDAP